MFLKLTRWNQPDGGAGAPAQTPPAPAAPASAPSDTPPAWAQALIAKVDALEAGKTKAEADKNALEQGKLTAEQRVAQLEAKAERASVHNELHDVAASFEFVSKKAREQALKLFQADYTVKAQGESVFAFGPDGKAQHVAKAFEAWAKADGANFIASKVQPGAGAPASAPPQGAGPVNVKTMSREDFRALMKEGYTGPLTPGGPPVTIRSNETRYDEMRKARMGAAIRYGVAGSGQNGTSGR